jgi:hypothetical protein
LLSLVQPVRSKYASYQVCFVRHGRAHNRPILAADSQWN